MIEKANNALYERFYNMRISLYSPMNHIIFEKYFEDLPIDTRRMEIGLDFMKFDHLVMLEVLKS